MVVPLEVPSKEGIPVVNAVLGDGEEARVRVYLSKGFDTPSRNFAPEKRATVSIFEDGRFMEKLLFDEDEKEYFSNSNLKSGAQYSVEVTVDGKTALGRTQVPFAATIDSVILHRNVRKDNNGKWESDIYFKFTDIDTDRNLYSLTFFSKNFECFLSDDPSLILPLEDQIEPGPVRFCHKGAMFSDDLFNGKDYYFRITLATVIIDNTDEFLVVLRTYNSDYYRYIKSAQKQQDNHGNPFSEPVIVFNNIENGLGIVAGYSEDVEVFVP